MARPRRWPSGGGIYAIHISGQPCYVGRTHNFAYRFGIHDSQLRAGKHKNQNLQRLFDNSPSAAFEVLEDLEGISYPANLYIERAWISWLHAKHGLTNEKDKLEVSVERKPL